jgi:hypothetical protein
MNRFHRFLLTIFVATTGLQAQPQPGQVFLLQPKQPRYATAYVEFRDPAGKFWPHYFVGRPSSEGQFVFDAAAPILTGQITADTVPQTGGSQDRRVLGELFTPGEGGRRTPPPVSFTYKQIASLVHPAKEKERENSRRAQANLTGTLQVAGKEVPFQGTTTFRFEGKGQDGPISEVHIHSTGMVEAAALGLKKVSGPVEVRIFTMAYTAGKKPLSK